MAQDIQICGGCGEYDYECTCKRDENRGGSQDAEAISRCAGVSGSAAIVAAQEVLKDEANELALVLMAEEWKPLPHRARVAIQREITRLRQVSENLSKEPQPPNDRMSDG